MSQKALAFNHVALHAQQYEKDLMRAFKKVIQSGWFFYGPETKKLEAHLSKMYDAHCISVTSGHDSLLLALQALSLKPTDEVILPANVYPTAFPVWMSSVKPVLVDVNEDGQMVAELIEKAITGRTRAIILVHLYGMTGEIVEIRALARRKGISLIEDCAQAFGTRYDNKLVGTFGDIACFSFYPTKNLGTFGDGGAVITKNARYAEKIRQARQYGEKTRYKSSFVAGHSRMSELQAAVLNVYLSHFEDSRKKRKKVYAAFVAAGLGKYVRVLETSEKSDPMRHLLVVEARKRNALMTHLKECDIDSLIHYPFPIHDIPAFKQSGKKLSFPIAERLCKNIVSLPFHEYMSEKDVAYIVKKIADFYERR